MKANSVSAQLGTQFASGPNTEGAPELEVENTCSKEFEEQFKGISVDSEAYLKSTRTSFTTEIETPTFSRVVGVTPGIFSAMSATSIPTLQNGTPMPVPMNEMMAEHNKKTGA